MIGVIFILCSLPNTALGAVYGQLAKLMADIGWAF
jgi:uncharacterized membrane protein